MNESQNFIKRLNIWAGHWERRDSGGFEGKGSYLPVRPGRSSIMGFFSFFKSESYSNQSILPQKNIIFNLNMVV
jgi:hypothetical protein